MERLTIRDGNEIYFNCEEIVDITEKEMKHLMLERLARYEDEEEQGRLIVLPCKVGCKVFLAEHGKILEEKVLGFIEAGCGLIMNVTYRDYVARPKCKSIGKLLDDDHLSVFLSREEAEKALEAKEKE